MSNVEEDSAFKVVVLGAGGVGKSAITIRFINGQFLEEYDPTIEDSYHKKSEVEFQDGSKETVVFSILDTAGQDEYKALQETWVRESKYFLLVYAIDKPSTFDQIKDDFIKIISRAHEVSEEPIFICVAGNKCDLRGNVTPDKFEIVLSEASSGNTNDFSTATQVRHTEDNKTYTTQYCGKKFVDELHVTMASAMGIDNNKGQKNDDYVKKLENLNKLIRRKFVETSAKNDTNITEAFHSLVKMQKQYHKEMANQEQGGGGGGGCCLLL